jgi:hypothetical protein
MSRDDGRPCDVTQEYRDNWAATFGRKPKRRVGPKPTVDQTAWWKCSGCGFMVRGEPECICGTTRDEVFALRALSTEAAASCALDGETHCVDEKGRLVP